MPASWERHNHADVLLYTLHAEQTSMAWAYGFRNLIIPGRGHFIGMAGRPFDHARNEACMVAIQGGYTHVFSLDSDVIPPRDAILRLLAHRKEFISGMYCRRSPPHAVPVMMKNGMWVTNPPPNQVIEVDVVGAGCLLVSVDLLKRTAPQREGHHWFDWRVHLAGIKPPGECQSEDFTFCIHLKRSLGVPTLVDTGVRCRHAGMAEADLGVFQPLSTTPHT